MEASRHAATGRPDRTYTVSPICCRREPPNFFFNCRYNNRTYRIDRVDWELSPESIFEKRSGEQLTYQEYYAKAYNKTLSDLEQPLLVHCAKKKGREDQLIYLVPELCCMTG